MTNEIEIVPSLYRTPAITNSTNEIHLCLPRGRILPAILIRFVILLCVSFLVPKFSKIPSLRPVAFR